MRARGFDRFSGLQAFMARLIVEDDDIARLKKGNELGFNPGLEALTVDRPIEHPRGIDPLEPEPSHEGQRLPVAMRHPAHKRGPTSTPAAHPGHVGLDPGLIHKDEPSWVNRVLVRFPAPSKACCLGP
jgi:hypothetical protein